MVILAMIGLTIGGALVLTWAEMLVLGALHAQVLPALIAASYVDLFPIVLFQILIVIFFGAAVDIIKALGD